MRSLRSAPDLAFLTARAFAHRGLHGQGGRSENGMAAFDAAIAAGFGIECDVRLSADGVAMVLHDATLMRLTGRAGLLANYSAADLAQCGLPDGGGIVRLVDLLDRVAANRTPLLIEIKVDRCAEIGRLCGAVLRDIRAIAAPCIAIMSFHPLVPRWFAVHARDVPRGLVVTARGRKGLRGRVSATLALTLGRPDFVACDISDLPSAFATRARCKGLPVLSWTVRTAQQRIRAARHADQIIFEEEAGA